MPSPTAIISGGGIGGLCAALALRRIGWRVAVYEAAPALSEIGAGLTLWPNALHALDRLGLGAATRALGVVDLDGGTIADRRGRVLATLSTTALAARHAAPIIVPKTSPLASPFNLSPRSAIAPTGAYHLTPQAGRSRGQGARRELLQCSSSRTQRPSNPDGWSLAIGLIAAAERTDRSKRRAGKPAGTSSLCLSDRY